MPEFVSPGVGVFSTWDYVVFAALFVVSSGIGIFFAVKERKKASSREFLVGGKQMSCVPVALSLTASFMSAVTVLGAPSEVYRFGGAFILFGFSYSMVVLFTAELFVPVFYRSGITSTYEYLELRFNKTVRIAATLIYIMQTIVYTGVVVYAPALALNQVTGFNLWGSIFATGIVCTFYCTLGGLKAVVWTDAFQMVVMVLGFLTVLIQGTIVNGGLTSAWEKAEAGSRLGVFDALYLNLIGLWVILGCAVFSGLLMFAYYRNCDPWTAGFVSAPDQLMPYFVMDILGSLPGLPGLFVACAFSGTLSTVAASINALATVTYEDLVKNCFKNLSNRLGTWISKGLCIVFGVACTSMAVAASQMGGVVQAALSIHGMCGGPMLGLFSLGILFPWTNWKGAAGGLVMGIAMSFWVGIGGFVYPAGPDKAFPLPLSTNSCLSLNITDIISTLAPTPAPERPALADTWYSMSYLYYSAVGWIATVIAGLLITSLTGPNRGEDVNPVLIRPVCNLLCFWSEKYKKMCWCGVQHDADCMEFHDNGAFSMKPETSTNKEPQNALNKDTENTMSGYNSEEKSYSNAGLSKDTYF
ncbi:Sodium-coupled monocarboxylate transporter 2 [Acipenser ruthenus]|uniref:Sodium-coupled monocarboxylate transporter 2 n=1 Tax=Acipenser ruthenus TaxID=7906 RepID=A0A444UH71_ACIRT|nr:Sodium-coupled monocarboxylate transporter 2 [Acipenser ruthenus]